MERRIRLHRKSLRTRTGRRKLSPAGDVLQQERGMSDPSGKTPSYIRPNDAPAAGLGALTGTLRHLRSEKAVARGARALLRLNQEDGVDCPGCAWPDPEHRSVAEFCENGAKAVAAEATTRRADPEFFARYTVDDLRARSDYWLEQQGRVSHPMIRRAGERRYEPLAWDDAFERVGAFLRELEDPDAAAFYTSGRTSNEAAFLYQLLGRMLGTNNFPDCSNLCHESSGVGLTRTIGAGKGSVQLSDFVKADAIFVIGQNPGTNHPRMLSVLQEARRNGAEIVSINPLRERGLERFVHPQEIVPMLIGRATPISTVYLQPKVGSDVALLKGIMKHVLAAERTAAGRVLDHGFIRAHTVGFDEMAADLDATEWSQIEEQTGLRENEIRTASDVYIRSRATIVCWAMGLTQHRNAVDNIVAISNLLLMKGNIGRPGAGPCPVRGHSNVQGDRTVGITTRPDTAFLDRLGEVFAFDPPREPGLDVVETIRAMRAGRIRFFMAMGGNFAAASPDTVLTTEALERVGLAVHVTTKLNRTHLVAGEESIILPCLGRTERDVQRGGEQFVTVEDSMSCVHRSRGTNAPASAELRSEPAIVAGIASRALAARGDVGMWEVMAADYDRVRERIEAVLPGFEGYNRRVREPGGFVLRQPAAHREWRTPSGRAHFEVVATPEIRLGADELRMFTIRTHDQYNTTIYGLDDRYRGLRGTRRVILMNPADIEARGLEPYEEVDLRASATDDRERVAPRFKVVPYDVPRGCAATYFPEANVLVPIGSTAEGSNTPSSKMVPITVSRATSPVRVVGADERVEPLGAGPEGANVPGGAAG
jgi:molybdopterin-dependent oxidoreductase alpha subunit